MQSNTILRSDVVSTEKLMGNNNNLNNNGSPGADIMFQMEDEGLTQLGSVFQSAYQSIVGGGPQHVIGTVTSELRHEYGRPHSPLVLSISPLPLFFPLFFSPYQLAVLYGTVHYFSTVYTAARSSLAYGLLAAVLLFDLKLQI
ncbi:hypothetical protein ACFW04_001663 [Cataglyphis niger]